MNRFSKKELLCGIFLMLQLLALVLGLSKYTAPSWLLYAIVTGFTVSGLFGPRPHNFLAVLWSFMTLYLLGWLGGIIEITIHWYLWYRKGGLSAGAGTRQAPRHTPPASSRVPTDWSTFTGEIQVKAILPIIRIPLPWITYTLTPKAVIRDSWFTEEDPEPVSRIENWNISGSAVRTITGTSRFSFRSKKPHESTYIKWGCLPAWFAEAVADYLAYLA